MPPIPSVTKAFMLACVGLFCLFKLAPISPAWFELWPLQSGNFMPWQLLSYAFLHGSELHLFFNMLGLWMFGSELERVWGGRRYTQILLASALSAAAVQLAFTFLMGSYAPTVGASAAASPISRIWAACSARIC
jgi:membrane associated rhomboid family serine protease